MRSEIVLIGPPFVGKSTIGTLLAEKLGLPQVSLDKLRWDYYREIGFDEALAQELRQKGGFLTVVAYWSLFNSHAIERVLTDHMDCVFDFGAGPILFENELQRDQIRRALSRFINVLRLLPFPDPEQSINRGSTPAQQSPYWHQCSRFRLEHIFCKTPAKRIVG